MNAHGGFYFPATHRRKTLLLYIYLENSYDLVSYMIVISAHFCTHDEKTTVFFPFNMHKKLLQKDTIVSLYIKKHKSANDFYQSSHT